MKHKLLTFALMGAFASTMLFSCKNAEEPLPPVDDIDSKEMVEYTISVNVPAEMRTRDSGSSNYFGESGLLEWNKREINKVWYAVYYDDELRTQSSISRNNNDPFKLSLTLRKDDDPAKVYLFFWAGNSQDRMSINGEAIQNRSYLSIDLDFEQRKVTMYTERFPYYPWSAGEGRSINEYVFYDSFTNYVQFSKVIDDTRTGTIMLKRPFVEFQILTDDFQDTDIGKLYSKGILVKSGFGAVSADNTNVNKTMVVPNIWYFDKPINNPGSIKSGDFIFSESLLNFDTNLNSKYTTTFKDRKMDYVSVFFTFAPTIQCPLVNNNETLNKLNFRITPIGNPEKQEYITVDLPEEGIKANNKYIIYNRSRENGGSGFLSASYTLSIICDDEWENPNSENEVERL